MYTILIAESQPSDARQLGDLLRQEGYRVLSALNLPRARQLIASEAVDLFVLTLHFNNWQGVALCRELRADARFTNTPIIFLGEQTSPNRAAEALDAGGDDFVRKPYSTRELLARVRTQLRRAGHYKEPDLPTIAIGMETHQVFVNNRETSLTRVEFDLLCYMCRVPDKWYTTRELLVNVWQYPGDVGDAALVRNHIRNLRCKIEDDPNRPTIIQSRHRRGYVVKAHILWEIPRQNRWL